MILKGEVLEDHGLLNMDTGERRKVRQFSEFTEFLEQYKLKRKAAEHQAALVRSSKVETASNAVKIFIAIGVLVVLGGAVAVYFLGIKPAQDEANRDSELADLFERGNIEITGTAGILPDPPRRRGGGGGARRAGGGGGGPGGLSYEDAMNEAVNMGDATQGGSERRLTPADVQGVMNRRLNSLFGCVGQERRRGGQLGRVTIDLAIMGSGRVQGASVRPGSGEFQSCISGRVRQIQFPAFPAPRMGARYSFEVD